ncbi:hypothetical protein EYC84_003189 [Monilinia fructicola]|uniref:Uncharacterized protein n=1 Tax=Monilinia fructicola TaxID=38448 RepID=A0A5M9JV78_MONFR|nr:hypothetical protein EYC84_003189 [Monilinia fructicola]
MRQGRRSVPLTTQHGAARRLRKRKRTGRNGTDRNGQERVTGKDADEQEEDYTTLAPHHIMSAEPCVSLLDSSFGEGTEGLFFLLL